MLCSDSVKIGSFFLREVQSFLEREQDCPVRWRKFLVTFLISSSSFGVPSNLLPADKLIALTSGDPYCEVVVSWAGNKDVRAIHTIKTQMHALTGYVQSLYLENLYSNCVSLWCLDVVKTPQGATSPPGSSCRHELPILDGRLITCFSGDGNLENPLSMLNVSARRSLSRSKEEVVSLCLPLFDFPVARHPSTS